MVSQTVKPPSVAQLPPPPHTAMVIDPEIRRLLKVIVDNQGIIVDNQMKQWNQNEIMDARVHKLRTDLNKNRTHDSQNVKN